MHALVRGHTDTINFDSEALSSQAHLRTLAAAASVAADRLPPWPPHLVAAAPAPTAPAPAGATAAALPADAVVPGAAAADSTSTPFAAADAEPDAAAACTARGTPSGAIGGGGEEAGACSGLMRSGCESAVGLMLADAWYSFTRLVRSSRSTW